MDCATTHHNAHKPKLSNEACWLRCLSCPMATPGCAGCSQPHQPSVWPKYCSRPTALPSKAASSTPAAHGRASACRPGASGRRTCHTSSNASTPAHSQAHINGQKLVRGARVLENKNGTASASAGPSQVKKCMCLAAPFMACADAMTPWAGGGAQATPLHVQPIHYPPPARIVAGPIMCGAARHYPLHATSSFANPNLPRLGGRVAHHAQIPWQRGFFHSYRVRDSYDRGTQRSHGSAQPPALRSVQRAHLRHKMQGKAFSPLGVMVATCLASGR